MNENPNREHGLYPSSNMDEGTYLDPNNTFLDKEKVKFDDQDKNGDSPLPPKNG